MKIYLVSQDLNNGHDTFDSIVVIAENEQDARTISPNDSVTHVKDNKWMATYSYGNNEGKEREITGHDWIPYKDIHLLNVKCIGTANESEKRGVVLSSFNAG